MRRCFKPILILSALAAFTGCNQSDNPLAPTEGVVEPTPATEPVAPADAVASDAVGMLTTSRILFESYTGEHSDIWTADPQGGGYVHLTSTAGDEYDPAWSYDHKRVAFSRMRVDANNVGHWDIYIMNADGTNKHWARSTTYTQDIFEPAWSPDGTNLLVTTRLGGYPVIAKLDLSTGNLVTVAPVGMLGVRGRKASYDPAGKTILYLDYLGYKIHRLVPGGEDKVLLTADRGIENATFSPDGKKIAYSRYVSTTNTEVFVLTLATGTKKRLTTNAARDGWATWSPDGTKLAFVSNRSGSYQIWTMNASTGGSLAQVTKVSGAGAPAWWH